MVFISYAKPNLAAAKKLAELLEESYTPCWYVERDNPLWVSGNRQQTLRAIEECEAFVLVTSAGETDDQNFREEIAYAHKLGKDSIEFVLDEVRPTGKLNPQVTLYSDGYANWDAAVEALRLMIEALDYFQSIVGATVPTTPVKRKMGAVKALSDIIGLRSTMAVLVLIALISISPLLGIPQMLRNFFQAATEPIPEITDESGNNPFDWIPRYHTSESWRLYTDYDGASDQVAERRTAFAYLDGNGAPQDDQEAIYWFSRAAIQGDAFSQYVLGWMHAQGRGTTQSHAMAVYWYRRAAEQGYCCAQTRLGLMYEGGNGTRQDFEMAAYMYTTAHENGCIHAAIHLATLYSTGRGVEENPQIAYYFMRLAATQETTVGHADKGLRPHAQASLGYMYDRGLGVERDHERAVYFFRQAALQGFQYGQNNLGGMYLTGRGTERDYEAAMYWFRQAAEAGHALAQTNLGSMYENGQGVEVSAERALYWYGRGALGGNARGAEGARRLIGE